MRFDDDMERPQLAPKQEPVFAYRPVVLILKPHVGMWGVFKAGGIMALFRTKEEALASYPSARSES